MTGELLLGEDHYSTHTKILKNRAPPSLRTKTAAGESIYLDPVKASFSKYSRTYGMCILNYFFFLPLKTEY